MSLTAKFISIDTENSLFKQITKAEILNLIERSQFNKRRKKLFLFSKQIRTKLASIFRKSRKRIETLFSQLCEQFRIRNNYAKSFQGFKTRILAKITALTLVHYINKFIFDRPINIYPPRLSISPL